MLVELVVHRARYQDCSLPKGKLDPGEKHKAAALREVREETGVACELGEKLCNLTYDTPLGPKRVKWWAMEPLQASASDGASLRPDDPTEIPRFGAWGEQKCEDTGPLTRKRMETVDEETLEGTAGREVLRIALDVVGDIHAVRGELQVVRGVQAAGSQNGGDDGCSGGFAMGAGYGDTVFEPH